MTARPGTRRRQQYVWLALSALLVLIVALRIMERHSTPPPMDSHGHAVGDARRLLPVALEQLDALELIYGGRLYRFERSESGDWFEHTHVGAEQPDPSHHHQADPDHSPHIEKVLAVFGRIRIEREFPYGEQAPDYGVSKPNLQILAYGADRLEPLGRYAVGDIAPDTISRYVMAVGSAVVVTIPNYHIENLLTLVDLEGQ